MKMTRRIVALLTALILVFTLAACGKEPEPVTTTTEVYPDMLVRDEKINVACFRAGSAVSLTHARATKEDACVITFSNSVDEITSLIKSGKADIAALPLNTAAQLYNKTNGGIKIMSITALNSLYLVEKGDIIKKLSDFKGKTVVTSGKGTVFDYYLLYVLKESGIDPETDITIRYLDTYDDVVADAKGENSSGLCVVPCNYACEILYAEKGYDTVESFTNILKLKTEMVFAAECLAVRTEYLEAHPDLVEEFLDFADMSATFITSSARAGLYLIDAKLFADEEKALANVFNCNPVCIQGDELVTLASENLKFLYELDPDSVGGALPDENIYYVL